MADTTDTKRRILAWAGVVHDLAARQLVNELSKNTPKTTGRLERARRRRDTQQGARFIATVTQPAGAGEPDGLPRWLDEGRQFTIRPRRPGGVLRFKVGARVVYARQVLWNRSQRSRGFWSDVVDEEGWDRSLRQAARGRPLD